MIYLIGGSARTGKTIIARRLLSERNYPYFCVDYFVSAQDQGAPELGINAESPNEKRARKLWPRYAGTTPEKKLKEIRWFRGSVNGWIQKHPDQYILDLAEEMIEFSRYVRDECNRYGLPHFDVSDNIASIVERAYLMLCGLE